MGMDRTKTEKVFILCFGQIIASFITISDILNEYLNRQDMSSPFFSTMLTFILISIVYNIIYLAKREFDVNLKLFMFYAFASVCDVTATWLIITSFNYISILNVILLKCMNSLIIQDFYCLYCLLKTIKILNNNIILLKI